MNETGSHPVMEGVTLFEDDFGFYVDKITGKSTSIRRFTWRNQNCVEVQVITYGTTITSIKVPDNNGVIEDIVMGFDNIEGYYQDLNPYFGATVGRVANRIGNSKFQIEGIPYNVSANRGTYTLHGGFKGFDKVVWNYHIQDKVVTFSYLSVDGEEGFPGDLVVSVKCVLTPENEFKMEMNAVTTKATTVNLTNHSYFNLAGHGKGAKELYNHVVQINANRWTAVDSDSIPTGELTPVADTLFNLQVPRKLGDVINNVPGGGYDFNFCINKNSKDDFVIFVARVVHPQSGRALEVYSNQPGVQFYTANFLPISENKEAKSKEMLYGKSNIPYNRHGSFCLETQNYPDAVNHANFPNAVLQPGDTYTQITHFVFPTSHR